MPETLVVGVGGVGLYVCRRLSERLEASAGGAGAPQVIALETDRGSAGSFAERTLLLGATAAVMDAAYRAPERFRAEWLNRELLRGRTSIDQGTGGSRMLARFLLLLPENRNLVVEGVRRWLRAVKQEGEAAPPRIYVVAGAAGGTGGGLVTDLGYLFQTAAAAEGVEVEVRALLFVPPPGEARLAPNAFATLTELHYFSDPCTVYRAFLSDAEIPFETRSAPYHRVQLATSTSTAGTTIPLQELQERAVIYLLTSTVGDRGEWAAVRAQEESQVTPVDADGNPQVFTTFGTEWLEYPESRLLDAVYRNLIRRSLVPWLQGDQPIALSDLTTHVPLRDPEGLAKQVSGLDGADSMERMLRPVRTRLPWIWKAPEQQWRVMDHEVETAIAETAGIDPPPPPGRHYPTPAQPPVPTRGALVERTRSVTTQALAELRVKTREFLVRENTNLERVARVLNEAATEVRTSSDPVSQWEDAAEASERSRDRVLWAASKARRDPYLTFYRRYALRQIAAEYEHVTAHRILHTLRLHAAPQMSVLRNELVEYIRAWAGRVGELGGLFTQLSRSMADYESALLEGLRREDDADRLALGQLNLPGAETPYVANTGWRLPYCSPEEENAVIGALRKGWIQRLVERDDALLAAPGKSVLDGPADTTREERLPWLMPATYVPTVDGASTRMREAVMYMDRDLRSIVEDRLRLWLASSAYQRLTERYRDPLELEFHLRRLVTTAADLPGLEPPHARPAGFPLEYELLFFAEAGTGAMPEPMRLVVEASSRERPTRVVASGSPHYLTAIAEHGGFALSRSPAFHQIAETYGHILQSQAGQGLFPFNRLDVPWLSATLLTRARYRDASDVLFLGLTFGVLHPSAGRIPLPASLVPGAAQRPRFPLPAEFDLAVRQLAGDPEVIDGLGQAVDRTVQSRGVEWCSLQLERALRGDIPLHVRFPGVDPGQQGRMARLAGLRATARYEDLFDEFSQSTLAKDTEWLRVGNTYHCPTCGTSLGSLPEALPGTCPSCREVLLPGRVRTAAARDGFRRIPNPFVVGTPLETGASVFVGREDIIEQVRERLIRPAQRTILIVIGERRCGKTSALRQLKQRISGDLTPIFVDLQGLTASDLPGFIYWLAWRMKEALDERGIQVNLPTWEEFNSGPADYQFETVILPEIRRKIGGGRVLLMLDEFEVLAQRVMSNSFDPRAFDYLRHLMQHGEGIEFLFAGTHILRQFAANYVTFLFNIGVFLNVDFLRPQDALKLIQEPVRAAGVTFTEDALEAVIELGGAHPYFTQMFGFHLVERLNRLRKRDVTGADVEAEAGPVIAAAGAHLDHVWGQLSAAERLLIAFFADLCPRGQSVREEDLLRAATQADVSLRPFVFRNAVEKLIAVGLLRPGDEEVEGRKVRTFRLTAEVYRQWLQTAHNYTRLREEGLRYE